LYSALGCRRIFEDEDDDEHEDDFGDLQRTIGTVAELLEDIIQRQIVTDVPLCSLLSGGLDSSAVTAMAHRAIAAQQGGRIRSFSVDFAQSWRSLRRGRLAQIV
jgi:asparagine synthetase B (glutamine-hydrolysing)